MFEIPIGRRIGRLPCSNHAGYPASQRACVPRAELLIQIVICIMPLGLRIKKYARQITSKRRNGDRASAPAGRPEKILNSWINVSRPNFLESGFDSSVSKGPNENMSAAA